MFFFITKKKNTQISRNSPKQEIIKIVKKYFVVKNVNSGR